MKTPRFAVTSFIPYFHFCRSAPVHNIRVYSRARGAAGEIFHPFPAHERAVFKGPVHIKTLVFAAA